MASARSDVLRVLLDSNAVDVLAALPERYDAIMSAVRNGRLEVLWTHITVDELAAIPDLDARARLTTIAAGMARLIPTGAAVTGFSRYGWARWTEDAEAVEAFRRGNLRHTRDALLAATAEREDCILITADRTLQARARARGVEVLQPDELTARL